MTKDELSKFVCADPTRNAICEAWSRGKFSYATDGYILVRIPRLSEIPDKETGPDVDNIFPKDDPWEWFILSEIPIEDQPICSSCDGVAVDLKCPNCNGRGKYKSEKKEYDCEECDGKGKIDCSKCLGTGKLLPVGIGNSHFNYALLKKLQIISSCKIGPMGASDPAWLKFDDGDGLLMPIRV